MSHPIEHLKRHLELTPGQESSLMSLMRERHFKRGDTISAVADMRANSIYIHRGSARVYYLRGGREQTFSFSFADEFVMPSYHLLEHPESQLTVEFLEPTIAYIIPMADMRMLMNELSRDHAAEAASIALTALFELTRKHEERILILQSASARERYNWLITRYPIILKRATITQIASYLGITKETLYRIRAGKYSSK